MTFDRQDWKVGTIYVFASRRRLDRSAIVSLLRSRASLKPKTADMLVGHWLTTIPFRKPRQEHVKQKLAA